MAKRQYFSSSEIKVFCQIGIAAGQVTFGSLLIALLPIDRDKLPVLTLLILLTLFFWGSSWYLTRRFKL